MGYALFIQKKKFIQTLPPEKRDGLIKSNIEELDDNDDIFCYNIIDYYQNRPDQLEDISLASFAANYEYYKHNTNTIQIQDDNIEEDDNTLATDHNTFATDHNTLATDHNTLATDHNTLAIDHNTLATDHTTLATDHNTLATDHNTLSTDHTI